MMSEILSACTALPGFDTLQILHYFDKSFLCLPIFSRHKGYHGGINAYWERKQLFKEVGIVKGGAMDALKQRRCRERKKGDEGRKATVRVIRLDWDLTFGLGWFQQETLDSVKVEECIAG